MSTSYEKYLRRLKGRINQNQNYASARRAAFATTPKQATFDTFLRRENVPVSVAAQFELDQQEVRQRSLTGVVERASVRDIERKERLRERIDEVKLQRDQAREQQKDKFGDTLLQAGGMALGAGAGALLAAPTGGLSIGLGAVFGASLGASAGQILGGFTGDNSEQITEGLGSAIQTFTQISTDVKMKELGTIGGEAQGIMSGLDEAGRANFLFQWQNALTVEQKRAVIQQYGGQGVLL